MKRFEGKVVLVTGGRTGIGRAIAIRLSDEGATVITAQRRKDEDFESIAADFSDPNCPQKLVEEVVSRHGKLDVLINNAGMMQEAYIEEITLEDWQRNITVNLTAPFLLIQAALPYLRQTKGNIVNTGSIEGLAANPNHTAYCTTKAGIHGLTRAVAVDAGSDGVRCNAIAPGWINTELNQDMINNSADAELFAETIGRIHLLGRAGETEEVASMVAMIASSDASFITGQIFTVDGGRMAKLSLP